jgi:cytochrome c oxidase assembly protein Cox11
VLLLHAARAEAGQSKQWPGVFVVDRKLQDVRTITLSYLLRVGGSAPVEAVPAAPRSGASRRAS